MSSGSLNAGIGSPGCVEHGQTLIIDDNLSAHQKREKKKGILKKEGSFGETAPLLRRSSSVPSILEVKEYGARSQDRIRTIRFQVVIWYVGTVDVVQGKVPMTFRVTLYWNDSDDEEGDGTDTDSVSNSVSSRSRTSWSMHGRQQAFENELKEIPLKAVNVPPVSILNVVTFDTIGSPEISMLREDTKLMRWTCMYRATLIQENMTVESFPHDRHELTLKLAILAHRGKDGQWDRDVWKLGLATNHDSQGTTLVPHGLVVTQVDIPEFYHSPKDLSFNIAPLQHGPVDRNDQCLEIKLPVLRESGYYDLNIMPLLALLNLVAVSIVCLEPEDFFQRGLLTLNIAFVEIGIRMTTDSHLPSVSYQIKMQRILNEYFCGLLFLVLESCVVYELHGHFGWSTSATSYIDWIAAILSMAHNAWTQLMYYRDARVAKQTMKLV